MSKQGSEQPFEHGKMMWGQSNQGPLVVAVRSDGAWDYWLDEWHDGLPEVTCPEAERGASHVVRGFGLAYCRERLWEASKMGLALSGEASVHDLRFEVEGAPVSVAVVRAGQRRVLPASMRGFAAPAPPPDVGRDLRARVGVNGRNEAVWRYGDYEALDRAGIEHLLLYSFTADEVLEKIAAQRPGIELACRLFWVGRFGRGGNHPTPTEFEEWARPHVARFLGAGCRDFQVHNEPNHLDGIEGWGREDRHAHDFNGWYLEVHDRVKQAHGQDVRLGFPGLAVPGTDDGHRTGRWLEVCRPAVERADWLGVHTYWQNPDESHQNHLDDFWGGNYRAYLEAFPDKPIIITEVGNSNTQNPEYPVDWSRIGEEYRWWLLDLWRLDAEHQVVAADFYTLSAPQGEWDGFAWVGEDGRMREPVQYVGGMTRPPLREDEPGPIPPEPEPEPGPGPAPEPAPGPDRHLLTLPSGKQINLRNVSHTVPLTDGVREVRISEPAGVREVEGREIVVYGATTLPLLGADRAAFEQRWRELEGG